MRKLAKEKQVMKRYGNLWSQICSIENIKESAFKAVKGKKMTRPRRWFIENREQCIEDIQQMLINEDYQFGSLRSFTVHEPKVREIHCSDFYPDRVLHHCLMNVIAPLFIEKFTADTYASIPSRGIAQLGGRLKKVLKRHPDWYYLQIDVKKFYPSIDHGVLKCQVRRVIKCKNTLRFIDAIIDSHNEGVPIGSFPSQYFANLMLSGVDHYVKEVLKVKCYYRYMDDMLFVVEDKAKAHELLHSVREKLIELRLTIKNNVRIAPVSTGIDFVGYKFYPTHTLLRKRIKLQMQRTVRYLHKRNVSDSYFMRKTASHFGWCIHADCRNLLRSVFKNKIYLYEHKMELQRLSEIKERQNWFSLPKDKRRSIEELFDVEIAFFDVKAAVIKAEEKVVVKFAYPDSPKDYHYFITRSDVMKDRLLKDKEHMPFIATIKRVKNYTAYE